MGTRTDGFHYRTHLLMDMDRSGGGGGGCGGTHTPSSSSSGFWLSPSEGRSSRRRSVSMARRTPSRAIKHNSIAPPPTTTPSNVNHHAPDGACEAAVAALSLVAGLSGKEVSDPRKEHRMELPNIRLSPPSSPRSQPEVAAGHDCFIIPTHHVDRFMPVPISEVSHRAFNMMQLEDPTVCIVLDFMEGLIPLSPSIPTLVSGPHPLTVHMAAVKETVKKVNEQGSALEGMILMNMERNATYPFIAYMVLNMSNTDPGKFLTQYQNIMVEHFAPAKIQHIGEHHISVYEEVATIARPPIDILPKKPSNTKTGYIITVFKVFPGDDREKLERSWLMWTGARMAYKYLPKCLGLKRITFHKKLWPNGGITYVLLIECSNLIDWVTEGCWFVEQLRARCCGYTGIYKIMDHF